MFNAPAPHRRRKLRAYLHVALLAFASVPIATEANVTTPTDGFGFNYWPQGYAGCQALTAAEWPAAKKTVAADLGLMKSLGAKTVRLSFWPTASGFNGGWRPDSGAACPRLPQMLELIENSGFKIVIAFSNTYVLKNDQGVENWKGVYPGGAGQDYQQFLVDSVNWMNGIVDLAKNSAAGDSVLYYDMQNEYDARLDQIDYYFRTMYQFSTIPTQKLGISVLRVPEDIAASNWKSISTQLQVLRATLPEAKLDYVGFHSYPTVPESRCPLHWQIEIAYNEMVNAFPNTLVVLSEFGRRATDPAGTNVTDAYPVECGPTPSAPIDRNWDEPHQAAAELDLIDRARIHGIPHALHWMLWDNTPPSTLAPSHPDAQAYGYGYTPHRPKDVIGHLAENRGVVSNADMETRIDGKPAQWAAGGWRPDGSLPVQFFASGGPGSGEAATRDYYARVQTQTSCSAPCVVWMQSGLFPVQPNRKLNINAYIRSNLANVSLNLVQYDAAGNRIATLSGPVFTPYTQPSDWAWHNYHVRIHQQSLGDVSASWGFVTSANATSAILTIGGTPTTAPGILDVDTVSATMD
jgi:hypothetical protein